MLLRDRISQRGQCGYITHMEGDAPETSAPRLIGSFMSILGYERKIAAAAVPASLADKRLDDHTVIL